MPPYHSTSRRAALGQMALLGSAAILAPNCLAARHSDDRKLGIALVGLGNYATMMLGPALRQTKHCELRGIVTGTPEKARKWQSEYGIAPAHIYDYQSFDQLKDDPDIDIVYIVLPNFMHAEYTIRALEMGKHVICEKPMGMDAAECRSMIAAARKAGRKLQVGYRLFYEPHHLELMNWAQQPHDGRIKMLETSLGFDMARPGLWRIDKRMGGGGALMDLGPYTIQAARRAAGQLPLSVRAQGYVDDPEIYKGIYGTYTWQLRFPGNVLSNSTASFSAYLDRYHVAKGNDFLELRPAFSANTKLSLHDWNGDRSLPCAEFQQATQMDAFARNILDDTPVVASGEEGLIDLQIIDAIKLAIQSGAEEKIDYAQ